MGTAEDRVAQLVTSDGDALLRYAYLLCRDTGRAEDLVQEALVKLLRRWRAHEPPAAPGSYARRVITNIYLDWRRLRSSGEVITDMTSAPVTNTGVADGVDARAERDVMWRAMATLPSRQRAALVLRYYEQLSDDEIADTLHCAPATVRSLVSRATTALRTHPQLARLESAPATHLSIEES